MKNLFVLLIIGYKRFLSPFLPPSCRFYPGCSDYARQALEAHGACKGSFFAVKRILRCHPLSAGGFDPVPERVHCDKNTI